METEQPRKRGAQPGNLNALKHGFYSRGLDRISREVLSEARALDVSDLTEEIAFLRERLWKATKVMPEHFDILCKVAGQLTRTVATHFAMRGGAADRLFDATDSILDEMRQMLLETAMLEEGMHGGN